MLNFTELYTFKEHFLHKPYVRHGEPDVDEDFTIDIGEKSFNSYVMTLSQSWYKLGNVHAGIGFLKEKE